MIVLTTMPPTYVSLYPGQWTNIGNCFSISKREPRGRAPCYDAGCRFIREFIFFLFPFPSRSLLFFVFFFFLFLFPFSFPLSSFLFLLFSSFCFFSLLLRALFRRPFLSSLSLSPPLSLFLSLSASLLPSGSVFSPVDVYSSR